MTDYSFMTQEIAALDKQIAALKGRRARLVAQEAKRKADALCAEMRKRKGK